MQKKPTIRDARPEDAAGVLDIYGPIVDKTHISFEEERPSLEQISERIARSHLWLVAELRERIVGYAYAAQFHPRSAYRWSTEVSVYVSPDARGHGLGRQLLGVLLERLSEMGFVNAFGGIALPNPASVRLLESLGFAKIAHWDRVGFKLGSWHDVDWWQLRLRDASIPPPPLTSQPQP
jgi:L-amino acid N-acyltransferase YncA